MKRIYLIALVVFLILLLLLASSFLVLNWRFKAPNKLSEYKVVEIKQGESINQIGLKLQDRGVIDDRLTFYLAERLYKKSLKAGFYQFSPKISIKQVIDQLEKGESSVIKVTIPEGWRLEQIAQELDEKGVIDYEEFIQTAQGFEGKLFPDTYFFTAKMDPQKVVQKFSEDFSAQTKDLDLPDEDLILASIVEREAVSDQERPLIAGIYKNRLRQNMKLDADPTTQFARDNEFTKKLSLDQLLTFDYWGKITIGDYQKYNSPYNTYLTAGLPKGPICNPGIKSIQAAINPEKSEYIYFLHKDGKIYPSKTLEEHNSNRERVLGVILKNK